MFRCAVILSLVGAAAVLAAPDPNEGKKDNPGVREVEVRFADGSTVRALLIQDKLEIVTKYGKLTVPSTEVRRIEFGLHTSDELSKKIDDAIRRLASDTFKDRDLAAQELVSLGAAAYPALKNAAKSADQEIGQRAKTALEKIRDRVPVAQLRVKPEDFIQTNEFPIQGKITMSTIKVRTAYFGDLDLKVADLRGIRLTSGGGDVQEVTVDATRYSLQDMSQWLDTGIAVDVDTPLTIAASGQVNLREGVGAQFMTGPAGNRAFARGRGDMPYPPGALLGRIGDNGAIFVIGERFENSPKQEGKLFVQIAPSPYSDNCSGSYKLKISGGRKEAAAEE
jgi:hypothetical protein